MKTLLQNLLARFSRVTSSGRQYIPQLDGLRFVAIAWVVAYHSVEYVLVKTGHLPDAPQVNPLVDTFQLDQASPLVSFFLVGHVGVDLFFVISGFILAAPLWEPLSTPLF